MQQSLTNQQIPAQKNLAANPDHARPKKRKKVAVSKKALPYLCILPAGAVFAVFYFFPFLRTLFLSFFLTDSEGNAKSFRGLKNYIQFFTSDDYLKVIANTFILAIVVIVGSIVIGFITANLANSKIRGFKVFPVLFTIPLAAAAGSFSLLFSKMFDPTMGIVNKLFHTNIGWFTDPKIALFTIAGITVWMMLGSNFLYLFAGLKNVPQELLESASIDGASGRVKMFSVILPSVSPTLFFVLITDIIAAFQAFTQIRVITQGGPANATNVMVYSIYQDAFFNFRFGQAAAQSIVLFIIVLIITLIQFKNEKRMVSYT